MELCVSPTSFNHGLICGEVSQHPQPNVLALLGMKLHTANIPFRHDRCIAHAILSLTYNKSFIYRFAVIRMHEVTKCSLFHTFKQLVRAFLMNPVPTDVRYHEIATEP